jgi:hypothetical protein
MEARRGNRGGRDAILMVQTTWVFRITSSAWHLRQAFMRLQEALLYS